jgi:hypothetical protein
MEGAAEMTKFTKPVCSTCGSDDVKVDAYAAWDPVRQEFELCSTFDKGSVCEVCGGEASLEDVALRGKELRNCRPTKTPQFNTATPWGSNYHPPHPRRRRRVLWRELNRIKKFEPRRPPSLSVWLTPSPWR